MSANTAIVELRHVSVAIEGTVILHDINLAVTRREHLAVIGSNGSGKSTLLALLAGQRWPVPGQGSRCYNFGNGPEFDAITARDRITLIGHELQDRYVARRWNFRVRDIVLSGLTRSDIPQRRVDADQLSTARELLDSMQIADLADRRLLELSRGEQRRVLITRALAFDPAVLLLDEPYSGLDAAARERLEQTLEVAAQRATLIIAAHRRSEAPAFASRIVALRRGRLSHGKLGDESRSAAATPQDVRAIVPAASPCNAPDPQGEVLIALRHASAWIDGHPALDDLNWTLRAGERWLVRGPNGAGKSTLLRLLHGNLRPAVGGSIRWPGLGNPRNVWTLRRQVALVSPELQARYRYPTTVFNAVASGFHSSIGLVRALNEEQTGRVDELLLAFRLHSLRERMLSSLSYGQRHRVLIARTLATAPRVLLLDEPWEGMDPDTTALIGEQLATHMPVTGAIVCVSHTGAGALAVNRRLELQNGRISDAGDTGAPREN